MIHVDKIFDCLLTRKFYFLISNKTKQNQGRGINGKRKHLRVQYSPVGRLQLQRDWGGGLQLNILANFPQKLHENENKLSRRKGASQVPLLGYATDRSKLQFSRVTSADFLQKQVSPWRLHLIM